MSEPGHTLLPVTILTGFLGSGKTTLLRRLINRPELAQCAVLINEIGEIGIDHHLVRDIHDDPIVLPNGCICCTVQSDLINALRELLFGRGRTGIARFPRVLIETTGLADPAPVVQALIRDPFVMQHYRLDGIVTLVDAVFGMSQIDVHPEAVKQIAVADRLVLTKTDLATVANRDALLARLGSLNPAAPLITAVLGDVEPSAILDTGFPKAPRDPRQVVRWIAAERYQPVSAVRRLHQPVPPAIHDDRVRSFVVYLTRQVDRKRLLATLDLLCTLLGERILRLKGLVDVSGESRPLVLHAVHHVLYPLFWLDAWPDGRRASALVFVVRDLDADHVFHTLAGMLGHDVLAAGRPGDTTPLFKESST